MENERLDFFDALRIVAGTERRVRYKEGIWWKWLQEPERAAVLVADEWHTSTWWPTIEQQKEKCWQVEPEKPPEVFVYLEHDGVNVGSFQFEGQIGYYNIPGDIQLPKIEPQKYRLIPADDPWPWRKFDPAKILDEKWYLVLWGNGNISKAFYNCQRKGSAGFVCRENSNLNSELIQAYIPIEEIPKPELNDD